MSDDSEAPAVRARRERSARYPGAPLSEAIELARFVDDQGLDGTSAEAIAASMGFESIKTRTFSTRLSAARQFGLLTLEGSGYRIAPLSRAILHPVDPADLPRLYREALKAPPLYSDLLVRLADRRVPDPDRLANLLYHSYQITASAKLAAAESFVESARFAGVLGDDGILRPDGGPSTRPPVEASAPPARREQIGLEREAEPRPLSRTASPESGVRIDLLLWESDAGKVVRIRAPEAMSAESFARVVEALRLHIRIDGGARPLPIEPIEPEG
ncbi:checkpoint protein HUS1 family protein [Tautonia rosea]|uniref:hypothetical protein n=1 Tax=Tautonia rosea TaxID=2728037 RepID=UPI0014758E62|nr:hypothetical protein [Tautonia rosea]